MNSIITRSLLLLTMVTPAVQLSAADDSSVRFRRDILPLLSDKCLHCHGPDSATREADLRLDDHAAVTADRDGTPAVVPGRPDASELIRRIESDDQAERMPPSDSGRSLSPAERQLLRQWVADGAPWAEHWSFEPPRRPSVPPATQPWRAWPQGAIDHFVLRKLRAAGMTPAAPAKRERLLRRVTFDLTGLPPTLAEQEAFLADDRPGAYERVVDRLLASPAAGEHLALEWLEAARYADTDGYQNDGPRTMWRWRDWVIEAINADLPFDQFTVEQLAGDLLPSPTLEQRIATGFNRNHRYNSEAGLVLQEFLLENAVDRVDTTATVWMGLTLGCARCHDHKYDPFSQAEYYQLISLFNQIGESGRAVKFGNSEPWLASPTRRQQQQLAELDEQIAEARRSLAEQAGNIDRAWRRWAATAAAADRAATVSLPELRYGLTHRFGFEDDEPAWTKLAKAAPARTPSPRGQGVVLDGDQGIELGQAGSLACHQRGSATFWLRADAGQDDGPPRVILSRQSGNTRRPGFVVQWEQGRLACYIITRWVAGVGAVRTTATLPTGEWLHVAVTNDGSQSARGMRIHINGKPAEVEFLYNTNSNTGATPKAPLRLGAGIVDGRFAGAIDELRFYSRTLFPDEIQALAEPQSVAGALADAAATPEAEPATPAAETPAVSDGTLAPHHLWFLEQQSPPQLALLQEWRRLRDRRIKLFDSLPTTMVMAPVAARQPTHIRLRGVYNQLGDIAAPGVPAKLGEAPVASRLDFARWLTDSRHPLTARVAVNRIWQHHFGRGLVATAEDFGLQGEPPSHPELLDWLAVEFVESGWSVKALHRQLVLSAAYRQAAAAEPAIRQADPDNRLLSRGPRLRLSAQALRDQALAASGLLAPRLGGPSVSPYQPANLWKEMSNMTYRQSRGADLYRRSLYTIWKRTVAPPAMSILDAADRESCVVRPQRTNTPLQALTLLNETTFVEASRKLAERMLREGGDQPLVHGFRLVLSRRPQPAELEALSAAHREFLAAFRAEPKRAKQLLQVGESAAAPSLKPGEVAALAAVANILLNLDEAVAR